MDVENPVGNFSEGGLVDKSTAEAGVRIDAHAPASRFYEQRPDGSLQPVAVPHEVVERAQAMTFLLRQGFTEDQIRLIWAGAPWTVVG